MTLSVAFQMDPLWGLSYEHDTSYVLIEEAFRRGYTVFCYEPQDLFWKTGRLYAPLRLLSPTPSGPILLSAGAPLDTALETLNMIHVRQNPPFDLPYITAAYCLGTLPKTTLVVNGSKGLLMAPEKLALLHFSDLMPPTLVTDDVSRIERFIDEQGPVILKPLYEFGGRGIMYAERGDVNLKGMVEFFKMAYPRLPIMVQRYIPSVITEGDKRLFWLDGEILGAFNRLPQNASIRSNTAQGGTIVPAEITDQDRVIVDRLTPFLRDHNIYFAGFDLIGGYLTEVNVTSPTGIRGLELLTGKKFGSQLWDCFVGMLT